MFAKSRGRILSYCPSGRSQRACCSAIHDPWKTAQNGKATITLSPDLQPFASLLDAQPPDVQEAFQFLLATAMHEDGKFGLLNVAEVDGR
jgi:hypothetical protein